VLFFSTIPFRTTFLDDQESNEDAVKTQQAAYVAAEPYQHTPLRDIQASWRSGSNQALFDCLFVFQRIEQLTASSAPKLWEPLELPSDSYEPEVNTTSKFPWSTLTPTLQYSLNIEIEYSNERLVLRAGCRAGLFAKETLQRVVDALDEALTDIIRHPANRAKNVPASLPPLPALTATPERESETAADSTSLPDALDVDESFSEQEELLRVAIIELTGVRKSAVGKRTPFYHFGIDSISAAQLVSRCRRKNLKLSIADVLSGIHIEGTCHALASRENQTQNSVSQIHIPPEVQHNVLAKLHLDAKDVETILPVLPVSGLY
jgi:ferricrocin synthase